MRRAFTISRRATSFCTSTSPPPINLSPWEQALFSFLRRAAAAATPSAPGPAVELRVAGGWVRDKLLARPTGDLDIAVRHQSGTAFASHLHAYAAHRHTLQAPTLRPREYVPDVSTVTCIEPKPSISRHLETAALSLDGRAVDFVQLRTEHYAQDADHRVPVVTAPTDPGSDACRRDFTVNALFYNLHSASVEDFTGCGVSDLRARVLRTPLPPATTMRDDPLRAMRAMRFATTLDFRLDQALRDAVSHPDVHALLMRRVSPERVGIEFARILAHRRALHGVREMHATKLLHAVFGDSLSRRPHSRRGTRRKVRAAQAAQDNEGEAGGDNGALALSPVSSGAELDIGRAVSRCETAVRLAERAVDTLPPDERDAFLAHGWEPLLYAALVGSASRCHAVITGRLRRPKRVQSAARQVLLQSLRLEAVLAGARVRGCRAGSTSQQGPGLGVGVYAGVRHAGGETGADADDELSDTQWADAAEVLRDAGAGLWVATALCAAARMRDDAVLPRLCRWGFSAAVCGVRPAVDGTRLQTELGLAGGPAVGRAVRQLVRVQLLAMRPGRCASASRTDGTADAASLASDEWIGHLRGGGELAVAARGGADWPRR